MPTRRPYKIPFREVIQPIIDEPLEMARRLDFADWLQRHGEAPRAGWIRECCAAWDALLPLALGSAIAAGPIVSAPWGTVDLTGSVVYRWQDLRPAYWTEIAGTAQTAYFGRIVLWTSTDDGVREIGSASWLPQALLDGWLEQIYLQSVVGSQLKLLTAWPESHRNLPFSIDTTYFRAAGIDNGLMRATLCLEGLQGITLSETEIRYACVKRFAELAPNLRYLRLYLNAAGTSLHILEQLSQLEKLRSLSIGGALPDDVSLLALTRIPNLQTLRLYGRKLTDDGLVQLGSIKTLRVVALDAPQVTRAGIEALRRARLDLTIRIEGDMRHRLGPA